MALADVLFLILRLWNQAVYSLAGHSIFLTVLAANQQCITQNITYGYLKAKEDLRSRLGDC